MVAFYFKLAARAIYLISTRQKFLVLPFKVRAILNLFRIVFMISKRKIPYLAKDVLGCLNGKFLIWQKTFSGV